MPSLPEIAHAESSESVRLDFPEPLNPTDRRIIELLTERYEGKEGIPFMVFSRDLTTTLIVPRTIGGRIPQLGWKDPNESKHSA